MSILPESSPSWMQPQTSAEQRMNFRLTGYWNDLRGAEPYARITDFNVETIPDFGQHAFMLDLQIDDQDPLIRLTGQHLAIECGKNVTGQRLSAVPADSLLARVARNFPQVVEDEAPREFAEELDNTDGGQVLYRGIMLPFSKDGAAIDYIVGAITSKTVNRDGEAVESPQMAQAPQLAQTPQLEQTGGDPLIEAPEQDFQDEQGARGLIALVETGINAGESEHGEGQPDLRASLDECQSFARQIRAAESRSHQALYEALERVYAFYHDAAADPEELEALVAEAGLTMQERAPFTPIVKLVFGADYDRTRLSEYAATLAYAKRMNQDTTSFRSFVESQEGGLKGCVKAERAARRAERGAGTTDTTEQARRQLRETEALGVVTENQPGGTEFVHLLGRRTAAQPGVIEILTVFDDKPATIDGLLRRAAKQTSRQESEVDPDDAGTVSSERG